ncbi:MULTISPECIES: hypothetical protein [Elizabethkingia]|uniref:hypothetical protein n=1 Tax=Elizabethkingia TaxID=308865 RepID=UPI000442B1CB|nr:MULTISPECIES: hypothetical protein [Elizabethkingia]MCT3765542.1 hypothetical protein [Elizabethkingia anophelis]MCT4051079.1 hypothetical protein [Elizabethkingia anophelis]MCT4093979.1 hypothetical protein [Elizabethkingia anophelis]MCT4160779.1 hypothetical protein [Elizabethkingia anophelis]MCT4185551.1 hypothetical protein [Elizabethkingia anophelis]
MAYSVIEQRTLDLNIFFKDDKKIIHLASAGGDLPINLLNSDEYNETFFEELIQLEPIFEIQINPNLIEILGNDENQINIEQYIYDFAEIAKRGIFSYDKTFLSNPESKKYHLVAMPLNPDKLNISSEKLIKINQIISTSFEIQNFEFIK